MKANGAVIGRRSVASRRNRDGLIKYAFNKTSQSGEDGIIDRVFTILPKTSNNEKRICVDVGAWDGVHLSNTYSLLVPQNESEEPKWKGILIEADLERYEQLKKLHEPLGNICLSTEVSCVVDSPKSLAYILQQQSPPVPKGFDFLSIDVDGPDYWLLDDVLKNGQYTPKLICIEFNPSMPDDLIYIQECSDSIRHGSSLSALFQLALENNYTLVETTLYNAFFLHTPFYLKYFKTEVSDPTIEALHESTMCTSLYQLYDGTLKISGCKKMLWHRLPIDEKKIQILPSKSRSFPFAPSTSNPLQKKYCISEEQSNQIRNDAIDMSPYCGTSSQCPSQALEATKKDCASRLFSQFQSNGFAFIRGTGLSSTTARNGLKATKAFLQDANESVRRSALTKDRARRGYSPMNTENFASLIGAKGHNDLVRKFRIGPLHANGEKHVYVDEQDRVTENSRVIETKNMSSPLLRPNIWPKDNDHWDTDEEQFFKNSTEEYYEASCKIANMVVQAICDGIRDVGKINTNSLNVLQSNENNLSHTSILTLLGYRIGTRHKGKLNRPLVASHTDVGVITMLLFDGGDCATLQRKASKGEENESDWIDVNLPNDVANDPVFVVNIGDCLSDLSDNALPSTLHRVMPLSGKESRNCLALFVGLDPEVELCLPSGETISYEEWRRRRIERATSVLKGK